MDKLVYQYIKRYEPNVEADDLSNLKKQLVILLNKLHDNKSVYKNLPFDYMPVDQQLKLMHHLPDFAGGRKTNYIQYDKNRCR